MLFTKHILIYITFKVTGEGLYLCVNVLHFSGNCPHLQGESGVVPLLWYLGENDLLLFGGKMWQFEFEWEKSIM